MSPEVESTFFALLRAGLWEKDIQVGSISLPTYESLTRLALEQCVMGLIAAGLEHVQDVKVPDKVLSYYHTRLAKMEDGNQMMNFFINLLEEQMRDADISAVLLKGQGLAQCYERPLWRVVGDIDFLLYADNYEKAKLLITPMATKCEKERVLDKHYGVYIKPWNIELHGTLHAGLSPSIDRLLDSIQNRIFAEKRFRLWQNEDVAIKLPCADDDVIYVFAHILQHFYRGGVGLKQVCDWCRLLWFYRDEIDINLLHSRLRSMRLESEWRAFAAFAVEYLGMPQDAMPLYDNNLSWKKKAGRIKTFLLKVGNFGQKRLPGQKDKAYIVRKILSFGQRIGDLYRHAFIFPLDSVRFLPAIVFNSLRSAAHGEG